MLARRLTLSNSTTFDNDGFASNNTGISGTGGQRDQFDYGVNLSRQQQNHETTAGGNLTRNAPLATLSGSYSQSSKYTRASGSPVWRGGGSGPAASTSLTSYRKPSPLFRRRARKNAYVNGQKYRTTNAQGTVIFRPCLALSRKFVAAEYRQYAEQNRVDWQPESGGSVPRRGGAGAFRYRPASTHGLFTPNARTVRR